MESCSSIEITFAVLFREVFFFSFFFFRSFVVKIFVVTRFVVSLFFFLFTKRVNQSGVFRNENENFIYENL